MKTRKVATDEAFLNEAQTLLSLPQAERNVALDMLQRLRASLDLLDFMGFVDEPVTRLSQSQAVAQTGLDALEEISALLVGPDKKVSPDELVLMVKNLAASARASFAAGGNGKPWSATLTEKTLSVAAVEAAESEIGASLQGLARSAASIGIEVSIECNTNMPDAPGGFILSGGINRGQGLISKLDDIHVKEMKEVKEVAL